MALFRKGKLHASPPLLFETPGKMYIAGTAHDVNTLTPIINDTFAPPMSAFNKSKSVYMMSSKSFNNTYSSTTSSYPHASTSHFSADCNVGYRTSISISSDGSAFTVPRSNGFNSYTGSTSYGVKVDNLTGEVINTSTSAPSVNGITFFTRKNGTFNSYASFAVSDVTASASSVVAGMMNDNASVMWHTVISNGDRGQIIHIGDSRTDILLSSTVGGYTLSSYDHTQTSTPSVYAKSVTGISHPVATGVTTIPTKSFKFDEGSRIFYIPTVNAVSGDNLIAFNVITYKDVAIPAQPASQYIIPSNGTNMLSSFSNLTNMTLNTITRETETHIYITVLPCRERSNNNTASMYALYTYRVAKNDLLNIEFIGHTEISNEYDMGGVVPYDNEASTLIIPTRGKSLVFATWENERYAIASSVPINAATISVDQTGRIWVTGSDDSLHVFGPTIANSVRISSDQTPPYTGGVINTNINIDAINFRGARVANNATITINSRNVEFEDGTKSLTLTTNESSVVKVPIKIRGAGKVNILASLTI